MVKKPYCMYIHRGGSSLKWDFHTIEVGISHLYICSVASLQNLPVLQYIREHGYKYATALQEVASGEKFSVDHATAIIVSRSVQTHSMVQ